MYPYAKDVYRLMSMSLHLLGSGGIDTGWHRGGNGGSRDDMRTDWPATGETSEPRGDAAGARNFSRHFETNRH